MPRAPALRTAPLGDAPLPCPRRHDASQPPTVPRADECVVGLSVRRSLLAVHTVVHVTLGMHRYLGGRVGWPVPGPNPICTRHQRSEPGLPLDQSFAGSLDRIAPPSAPPGRSRRGGTRSEFWASPTPTDNPSRGAEAISHARHGLYRSACIHARRVCRKPTYVRVDGAQASGARLIPNGEAHVGPGEDPPWTGEQKLEDSKLEGPQRQVDTIGEKAST